MLAPCYFIHGRSRATLLQSVVLSGGSTLLRGFGDRLLSELKRVRGLSCAIARAEGADNQQAAPQGTKLRITASPERQCGARHHATAPYFSRLFRMNHAARAQVHDVDWRLYIVQPVHVLHHVGDSAGLRSGPARNIQEVFVSGGVHERASANANK
jgi:hypothetical protein